MLFPANGFAFSTVYFLIKLNIWFSAVDKLIAEFLDASVNPVYENKRRKFTVRNIERKKWLPLRVVRYTTDSCSWESRRFGEW